MADLTATTGLVVPTRYHDNGDGTWSQILTTATPRNTDVLHRSAIAAADVLATPGIPTASAVTEAGSTLANVAYHFAVSAGNRWGMTTATVDGGAVTPTANQSLRVVVAQIAGADYYDIFLSTAAAPLWVGRITEAQRATGDQIISTVGTASARAGSTVAGTIDVGIVGTGVAQTAAPYLSNAAVTPASIASPIDCLGFNSIGIKYKVTLNGGSVVPTFISRVMFKGSLSTADWFSLSPVANAPLGTASAVPLEILATATVASARAVVVVLNSIAASISAIDVWVDLF